MPKMVTVPAWDVFGWGRGRWTLRSTHPTLADAGRAVDRLRRDGVRVQVRLRERRVPGLVQPAAPSAARRHREDAAGRMVVLRQATSYYKSPGSVLTQLPKESSAE